MKTLGFILDSFTSEPKKDVENRGYAFIPFTCKIGEKEYVDNGETISHVDLLKAIQKEGKAKTSMASPAIIEETFKKMSSKYDYVIYLPIGDCLSSSFKVSSAIAKDFKNIYVINNTFTGDQYNVVARYLSRYFEKYQDIDKTLVELQWIIKNSIVYVYSVQLKYLIEGGRVSSFKRFLLKTAAVMQLRPYIKYYDNKAGFGGIAKGHKGVINQIFNKMLSFSKAKNKDIPEKYLVHWIHGISDDINKQVKDIAKTREILISSERDTSSAVAAHTGPEAISLSIMPNLDKKEI